MRQAKFHTHKITGKIMVRGILIFPPRGLPPYRGEEVARSNDPERYAGGSVSSW
jgi:hypothetical protein